jgi:Apea-like HEPN
VTDPSNDDVLAHLRPALEVWTGEVVTHIAANPDALLFALPNERWQIGEDSQYIRREFLTFLLKPGASEVLEQLPGYKALDDAAKRSPVIAPMLGKLVGTPRMYAPFTIWTLANAFIPDFDDVAHGRAYSFEDRYNNVVDQLTRREMDYQVTCPLQGVSFEETVELAPGLLVARLTSDEVIDALLSGVLPSTRPSWPVFHIQDGNSFALKKISRLPLIVKSPDELIGNVLPDQQLLSASNANEEVDQLLQCLALMTHHQISVSGSMFKSVGRHFLVDDSAIMSGPVQAADPRFIFNPYELDHDKCEELKRIWVLSHDESFPQNKAVALALRRLSFATQRTRPEDRLMDVFIAAEALYLTDAGDTKDRGELKYRLGLRAAVWSEGALPGWTKREVFRQMRRGYDVRSVVAHGGVPEPSDIKVKDARVSLAQLVEATEEIVRSGLYKAIQQLGGAGRRLSIPWDDLVLPE